MLANYFSEFKGKPLSWKIKVTLRILRFHLYYLPKTILYPLVPKYVYFKSLRGAVGYIATNGKTVVYGQKGNYNRLNFFGMIP